MSDAIAALIEGERLPQDYRELVDAYWRPLAGEIARRAETTSPLLVGINGAQGSGKTTACKFLEVLLRELGLAVATLGIDDLYLSRAERAKVAAEHHPLFVTRGVPGTHDVGRAKTIFERLLAGKSAELPVFDKAHDEPAAETRHVEGPVDILLFEGWCVGAAPQPTAALREPVNGLERDEDPDGAWRGEVNRRLAADYAELFGAIDMLVMFKVSDFGAVRAHRRRQERRLGAGPAVMDDAALDRFLSHYQRLTEWTFAEMPSRADIVIEVGRGQRPVRVSSRGQSV